MNLRIIAGKFGGRNIQAPDGFTTHPMSERIRGSLFNIVGDKVKDAEVLDAFAGSGALGLEALSRGAKNAVFVERDHTASRILADNIADLDVGESARLARMGARTWLDANQDKKFDLIFVDPPYNKLQLSTVFDLTGLLKTNGLMVLSYPGRGELPSPAGVVVVDNRSYGDAALTFYRKKQ